MHERRDRDKRAFLGGAEPTRKKDWRLLGAKDSRIKGSVYGNCLLVGKKSVFGETAIPETVEFLLGLGRNEGSEAVKKILVGMMILTGQGPQKPFDGLAILFPDWPDIEPTIQREISR